MVIKKMSEMIDSKPGSQDPGIGASVPNNNGAVTDKENNIEVRYSLFLCYYVVPSTHTNGNNASSRKVVTYTSLCSWCCRLSFLSILFYF